MSRLRALAALALAASGIAAAGPVSLRGVAAHARVGDRMTVEWPAALPGTEAELMLSLDGGRTFPVRVTAEHSPGARSAAFRVPNLACRQAVLALRTGDGEGEETIRAFSAEFTIEADPTAPAEPLVRVGDELATRDAASSADPPLPAGLASPEPRVSPLAAGLDAADAPGLPDLAPEERSPAPAGDAPSARAPRAGRFLPRISAPKRE